MFPSIYKKLRKWQEDSNSVNILVTGKTGTGKSALINALTGQDISKEGNTLKPETKKIEYAFKTVGSVRLQVWDSPGLQDGLFDDKGTEAEAAYIREIVHSCSKFDLLVYTIRMSQSRILKNGPDCKAMQILSQPNALGPNMWHNTIIVLTYANIAEEMVKDNIDLDDLDSSQETEDIKMHEQFMEDYHSSVTAIQNILTDSVGLSKKLAQSIPIVLAGYAKDSPTLPKYLEIADDQRYHWLSDLWLKALQVTKLDAQPAMIKMNEHRMAESREEYEGSLNSSKAAIAKQMPLIFGAKGGEIGKRMYHIFHGVGIRVGTVTGAGLGYYLSFAVLADQGSKSKILTKEEYKELQKQCGVQETEEGFLNVHSHT